MSYFKSPEHLTNLESARKKSFDQYNGSPEHRANLEKARQAAVRKVQCLFCSEERTLGNIKKHEASCHLNPVNHRACIVCENPIKNYKTSVTCGYGCANTHFRTGLSNPNWRESTYRTTCFKHHEKKCVVCDESVIVAVHHFDENRENNDPSNLIPMCPTHHQYWHSRHRHVVEAKVLAYIDGWRKRQ